MTYLVLALVPTRWAYYIFGCAMLWGISAPQAAAAAESCLPRSFADGDTFTYFIDTTSKTVRVAGFDAPERGQPYWRSARDRLRALTAGGALCDCYKVDRYGRQVCNVRLADGSNVATHMLVDGFGCIDPRFEDEASSTDKHAAREALRAAQAAGRGMWAEPGAMCGFEYRKRRAVPIG